jgi:P4 family phage/plasmid primase-like protien
MLLMTAYSNQTELPPIDADAIRTFCDVLFGYLDGFVPIRVLSETGTTVQTPHVEFPHVPATADRLIRIAPRAAEAFRGLYVVPGTVQTTGSAKAHDIAQTGVVLVDLDTGDIGAARDHLVRYLGPPTIEVASGGLTEVGQKKLHLYWRLTEPAEGEDLITVAALRAAIAAKVGGDGSFGSIHQPIRVAGSIHGKNGKRSPVRLLAHVPVEYDLKDLADAVVAMPAIASHEIGVDPVLHDTHGPSAKDLATQRVRAGGADGITRFEAMSRVIGHWLRNVRSGRCSIEGSLVAVLEHNTTMIDPPWDEARVRREFDALLKRDIEKNGPMPYGSPMDAGAGGDALAGVPPKHSDDALAAVFVARHGSMTRRVETWGSWFVWSGRVWERDETGSTREMMRQVCRTAASTADNPNHARRIASDKTIAAALRIVGSDPSIATRTAEWDAHAILLNTPAGIVDLDTGEIIAHDPSLLLTQITSASPGTECPRWLGFLVTITGGDRDLQAYLQRLAGYCLTGQTSEQVFAFLHGTGANGKSVFLGTIARVLGSYAATATLDTFMASKSERHLTELAGLRAARLVIVPETEAGRAWSEARIKMVTGGESIRANFMRCDHFEFRPQFKLVVMGNHRPAITSVGEAMRRRLHMVPFAVTIPEDARDGTLQDKLIEERDGILGWMLEGCAEWRRHGLMPPPSVAEAAKDYFASEDLVGQWFVECCSAEPEAWTASTRLFASWRDWADALGHPAGSSKALGEALRSRGLSDAKSRGVRGWQGISLIRNGTAAEVAI